jgi:hypothetical protein
MPILSRINPIPHIDIYFSKIHYRLKIIWNKLTPWLMELGN